MSGYSSCSMRWWGCDPIYKIALDILMHTCIGCHMIEVPPIEQNLTRDERIETSPSQR